MEENKELQDSPTPEDSQEKTEEGKVETPNEKQETVSKEDYDKLYSRTQRAEKTIEKYKQVDKPTEQGEKPVEEKKVDDPFDVMADNLAVMRDLDGNELTEMRTQAKSMGIHPVNFIKSKAGQSYLKSFRKEQKVAQATPSPTNRAATHKTAKDFGKMNSKEREATYGFDAWKANKARKSG